MSASLGMSTDLTAAGDRMQSEASRLLTWAQTGIREGAVDPPYEVHMAMVGLDDAIEDWTAARSATQEGEDG